MRGLFFAVVLTVVGNWMVAGAATPDIVVEHPMSSKTTMVRSPQEKASHFNSCFPMLVSLFHLAQLLDCLSLLFARSQRACKL